MLLSHYMGGIGRKKITHSRASKFMMGLTLSVQLMSAFYGMDMMEILALVLDSKFPNTMIYHFQRLSDIKLPYRGDIQTEKSRVCPLFPLMMNPVCSKDLQSFLASLTATRQILDVSWPQTKAITVASLKHSRLLCLLSALSIQMTWTMLH